MSLPLVSVAVITYNQEDFIGEALESVLSQDYKNLEVVVADDASTDRTPIILRAYSDKYPGIFKLVLASENGGVTKNSNAALSACSGKYIAWLGGDDVFLPGKISAQVEFMEKESKCSILYHDLEIFDSVTNKTLGFMDARFEGKIQTMIRHGCFNGGCSTMVRRSCCPEEGFNEFIPVASDWLHWVGCLASGGEIMRLDGVWARYRRHDSNVTSQTKLVNPIIVDKLSTITMIMLEYPEHTSIALTNLANTIRGVALKDERRYIKYLLASFKIKPTFKTFILIIVYFLSFGRYRKARNERGA